MRIDETVGSAIGLFDKEMSAIRLDLQNAVRRAADERTRDAGENAQKHPVQSSTTLKDSSHRAHAAVARLEKKYGPTIGSALSGLVSIAFAREYVAHVDRAIERDQSAKREKGESGLYPEARKAVDRIFDFGAGKWHWAQQADSELKIFSDLLRWKGESATHDNPNSPWPEIYALYEKRHMRHDSIGKLELSLPRNPKSGFLPAKPISQIPTVADMHVIAGNWASYSTYGSARRTEGVGRLDTDDPYGGFLRRKYTDSVMPMQDREDTYAPASACLSAEHWNRFDVPRSTYAVVQVGGRFEFPGLAQLYPPLAELRLLGVTLNYDRHRQRELEEAEAGQAVSDILVETVRACFVEHNKCHDEDLIRFWLFLLVGRKYAERIDALFPPGYFHGVRGPDIWESRDCPSHFQIARVAADRDYRHMMRHPDFGPWQSL